MSIEKTVRLAMLFDFYGALLTARQRELFELYYNDDLSLAEIAAGEGVSRQAVSDGLAKAGAALEGFEAAVGALKTRENILACAKKLESLAENNPASAELLQICRTLRGDFIGI